MSRIAAARVHGQARLAHARTRLAEHLGRALVLAFASASTVSGQHAVPHERGAFGAWEAPFDHDLTGFGPPFMRFEAVHMALVPRGPHRGQALLWDVRGPQPTPSWNQRWSLLDLSGSAPVFLNAELALPVDGGDFFCAGHAWTSRGKLLVAGGTTRYPGQGERLHGGTAGGRLVYVFDPELMTWERLPDLAFDRWYPTVLALDTGEVLVAGGRPESSAEPYNDYEMVMPELGVGAGHVRPAAPCVFAGPALPASAFGLYPRMHQLSTGAQFVSGMGGASARMRHSEAPGVWTFTDSAAWEERDYVCSVLFPVPFGAPDVVMSIGGEAMDAFGSLGVLGTVEACQPGASGAPDWNWTKWPSLHIPRTRANAVILPDRSVLVVGGRSNPSGGTEVDVRYPELFDGHRWHWMAPASAARGYHSAALLLPDGRVLTGGGDRTRFDYQVFVPPYLLNRHPRPVVTSAPALVGYAPANPGGFALDFAALPAGESIDHLALVAPGSVTHAFDASQRYVELAHVATGATSLVFDGPLDASHAPPGFYMLFLVSSAGVPSVAEWVELR